VLTEFLELLAREDVGGHVAEHDGVELGPLLRALGERVDVDVALLAALARR